MGYSHGKRWTYEDIKNEIYEVIDFLGIQRMPSRQEIEDYYSNSSLTNKISKTGGLYKWAKILGLEVKKSDTKLGIQYEQTIKEKLEKIGFTCELTSIRHPYDILVNGRVKIDVKVENISKVRGYDVYSFRLEKRMQTCDLYVAICLDEKKQMKKTYVIPSSIMSGKCQLCIGVWKSKYDVFLEGWDLINDFDIAMKKIEELRKGTA